MKYKTLLASLLILFCFGSCQKQSPIKLLNTIQEEEVYIPLVDNNREVVQVIKIIIKNEQMEVLATYPLYYPLESLDENEAAYLTHSICSENPNLCEDIKLRFSLWDIYLSPDKSKLGWRENLSWCSGTTCYGLDRIISYISNKNTKQTLIELPYHADLVTRQNLSTFLWSPNNLQIAFAYFSDDSLRMKYVDSETRLIVDVGDGSTPFDWSPDGKHLASTLYSPLNNQWEIYIIDLSGAKTIFPLPNLKIIESLDWSPDGTKIAISAWDGQGDEKPKFNIYILDLDSGDMTNISPKEDFSYRKVQWSPDGKILGTLSSSINIENSIQLHFLDTNSWEVMSIFESGDSDTSWQWSRNSQAVLSRTIDNGSVKVVIYNMVDQNISLVNFPKQLLSEIENGNIEIGLPAW